MILPGAEPCTSGNSTQHTAGGGRAGWGAGTSKVGNERMENSWIQGASRPLTPGPAGAPCRVGSGACSSDATPLRAPQPPQNARREGVSHLEGGPLKGFSLPLKE